MGNATVCAPDCCDGCTGFGDCGCIDLARNILEGSKYYQGAFYFGGRFDCRDLECAEAEREEWAITHRVQVMRIGRMTKIVHLDTVSDGYAEKCVGV